MSEIYRDKFRKEVLSLTEEAEYEEIIFKIEGEDNRHALTFKDAGEMCTKLSERLFDASNHEYPTCGVRQHSELLKAFMQWQMNQDISQFDDPEATIKKYLQSLNCA